MPDAQALQSELVSVCKCLNHYKVMSLGIGRVRRAARA